MIQNIQTIQTIQNTHTIYILNGPNLQLLGKREPHIYGHASLQDLEVLLNQHLLRLQHLQQLQLKQTLANTNTNTNATVVLEMFQTNHEGAMLDFIGDAFLKHQTQQTKASCIINMGAWTHTSIALRDALLASTFAFVEVHISNIYQREPFRQHSYFADKALALISGLGLQGYVAALEYLFNTINLNRLDSLEDLKK